MSELPSLRAVTARDCPPDSVFVSDRTCFCFASELWGRRTDGRMMISEVDNCPPRRGRSVAAESRSALCRPPSVGFLLLLLLSVAATSTSRSLLWKCKLLLTSLSLSLAPILLCPPYFCFSTAVLVIPLSCWRRPFRRNYTSPFPLSLPPSSLFPGVCTHSLTE